MKYQHNMHRNDQINQNTYLQLKRKSYLKKLPDELKIAKVVPMYKQDNPALFDNYIPVSVLPCLSKIPERIVYNRSYVFLCKNNVLYQKQYGFRSNHSVSNFVNDRSSAIDRGMKTIGIFLDLSKKHLTRLITIFY